jgi:[calcium/calmodulin-dependent protein kinase] kinase
MYLVLEYMKMGDLINVLKSRGADATTNTVTAGPDGSSAEGGTFTPLTDLEVWNIFRQVVSGIRYLHYQNVVHGDIKPQVRMHQPNAFSVLCHCSLCAC